MPGFQPLPAQVDLPALEQEVLTRWQDAGIFERSLKQTAGGPAWIFYEGPPTANGMPGAHHVEARTFKDLFPRFKTMQGFHVPRKGGWDCHGLPVEVAVEKELGLTGKRDIEAYGVAEFNARCRESVLRYVDAWLEMSRRMGYWADTDNAYRTMDPSYIESVWWSLKNIYEQGLLVRDHRISPYCPRCGTPLSDHEMGQEDVYQTVSDPAVTVRFRLRTLPEGAPRQLEGADLLVWTTTPWTLVSNTAVAVHPDATYVVARRSTDGDRVVVADDLFARVLGDGWHVAARFSGQALVGASYQPPFGIIKIPDAHIVVPGSFVTTEDGTGLVHLAPAFGAEDMEASRAYGLPVVNPIRPDGHFEDDVPMVGGMFFKDADQRLIADLGDRGLLFRSERHMHSYPHCWRCGTLLLYYAVPSWFIKTTAIKDKLLAENERTNWYPATVKHGRYGEWLRKNVDWALSRTRYWGTPLPLWVCSESHLTCVGSLAELSELAERDLMAARPAPAVRGRDHVLLSFVRRARAAGTRGDRRLVRLGRDAVRAARRAAAQRGGVLRVVSGAVHLRGAGPDPGLVLLADGRGDDGVRPFGVRERGVRGVARGRDRPQDEQAPGQRARADATDGRARRRRAALVLRGLGLAVGRAAGGTRPARRDRQEGAAHLLEHGVVPGPVRERGQLDGRGPLPFAARRGPAADRPVDAQRVARGGPGCHGVA